MDINLANNNVIEVAPLEGMRINRERLHEQVADQIQEIIIQGGIVPGDRLPPERQMAKQLGVSRTVIREATKVLKTRGLVTILTGSGTFVSAVPAKIAAQSFSLYMRGHRYSFRDLLEIRRLLEVELSGLAAKHATQEDLDTLNLAVNEMENVLPILRERKDWLEQFVQADMLFHQAIARASKNELMPIILLPINELLFEFSRKASSMDGAPESATKFHKEILDCIQKHDSPRCREVMLEHLLKAEEFVPYENDFY